jgi:lipoprotein-anchoring transpeptidase ErfK/SrfK
MTQLMRKVLFISSLIALFTISQAFLPTSVSAKGKRVAVYTKSHPQYTKRVRTRKPTRIVNSAPIAPIIISNLDSSGDSNKRIVVSLSRESLIAYDGDRIVLQTPITAGGRQTPTPVGSYQVIGKQHNFVMHSPWPKSDSRWYPNSFVHYGLLFDGGGYFIHDAPWRKHYGVGSNARAGRPGGSYTGTHGCVNVPSKVGAALYGWAPVGTPVIIES